MAKCPCSIRCISYAICKHKSFDRLLHGCEILRAYVSPGSVLHNERCRELNKYLKSTEWKIKIVGERHQYEVVVGRYNGPKYPVGPPYQGKWEWKRILRVDYDY